MTPLPPSGLYAITSEALCREPDRLLTSVQAALRGGAALLQYRDKHNPPAQRRLLAARLLDLCRASGVPLLINDDPALAAALGADGVHLGQGDASLAEARALLGPRALIGITCGASLERALAAEQGGASYVAFGAVYPSRTKPEAPVLGLPQLGALVSQLRVPVCAIGGINAVRAAEVFATGVRYVAAIDGVFGASDPEAAARAYCQAPRGA